MLADLTGRWHMTQILEARRNGASANFQQFAESDTFTAAIKFFRDKQILTKKEFAKLEEQMRKLSFTIAGVSNERLLDRSKTILGEYLESGKNIDEFYSDLESVFDRAGVSALNPYHIETVFRTNVQTVMNQGRRETMDASDVEEFPLYEFEAVGDDRTRASHLKYDGYRAKRDDPIWNQIWPPLGFNCRCTVSPVHVSENLKPWKKKPKLEGEGLDFVADAKKAPRRKKAAIRRARVKEAAKKAIEYRPASVVRADIIAEQKRYDRKLSKLREKNEKLSAEMAKANYRVTPRMSREEMTPYLEKMKDMSTQIAPIAEKIKQIEEEARRTLRKLLYVNEKGFSIRAKLRTTDRYLKTKWQEGVDELSRFVDKSILPTKDVDIRRHRGYRAYYDPSNSSAYLTGESTATLIHEFGHWIEHKNAAILNKLLEFYDKRTHGEAATWLGRGYARHEITRRDKFLESYMGKEYGRKATEILSMGLEMFYKDPYRLASQDPEYFDFIYNLVRGIE